MPILPHVVSGTAHKGPYEGYSIVSSTISSGEGQTVDIYVSDGCEKAEGETITLVHTNGTLTATVDSDGHYAIDLGNLSSYSEGDAFTIALDTRSSDSDDPQDVRHIMLQDERGKIHDDKYPINVRQVDRLISHPDVVGNVETSWTYSNNRASTEIVTFPNGTAYRRSYSYDSSGKMKTRGRWKKV